MDRHMKVLALKVLVDSNLDPWLLEVDRSPALACTSSLKDARSELARQVDRRVKEKLMREVWELLARVTPDPTIYNPETFQGWPKAFGSLLETLNHLLHDQAASQPIQPNAPLHQPLMATLAQTTRYSFPETFRMEVKGGAANEPLTSRYEPLRAATDSARQTAGEHPKYHQKATSELVLRPE